VNRLRRVMARIYDGSVVIGWRAARWPWETAEWWARARRLAWQGALGWAAWQITGHYPGTRWLAVIVYCWWAYRLGSPAPLRGEEPEDEPLVELDEPGLDDDLDHELAVEGVRAAILPRIRALIGDGTGVHLDTLHRLLIAEGQLPDWYELSELRRKLVAAGIPVRASLKVAGVVRIGVHRDDLPGPSPTAP
jgi:hypothetical protein